MAIRPGVDWEVWGKTVATIDEYLSLPQAPFPSLPEAGGDNYNLAPFSFREAGTFSAIAGPLRTSVSSEIQRSSGCES